VKPDLVQASIARAAQRERDRHRFSSDPAIQEIAQAMWRAFLANPARAGWSQRRLATMFGINHAPAHRVRLWIMSFPRPPAPPIVSDKIAEDLKEWRKALRCCKD
jgi:hypothetical protein